jgi:glycyl-tRNA synthetase beta chain
LPSLLLEIGCEELPASACRDAERQLREDWIPQLRVARASVYVSPRRLAVLAEDPLERASDEERRGPGEGVAFDAEGKPTKAAEGFARGLGLSVDKLERREGYVWARIPGEDLIASLPDRLWQVATGVAFSKSMEWNAGEERLRYARPIRWTCAKLDGETIRVSRGDIPSEGFTYGHRFTSGRLDVPHADRYLDVLREAGVEPDAGERRKTIVKGLDAIGGWSDPFRKLDEVVYLVESPIVLQGSFDERLLQLPERVIVTAMQSHQRYFPLGGNRFAVVANGGDPDTVRTGNEQVLEARLEDARFTFERDVAVGIDALAERLGSITYFAGAGSFAEKVERLSKLVERLGGGEASLEAARLAKADQAAELVREFPDLEGHIGAEYARLAGYPEAVCAAIDEQYLPDSAGGPLPQTGAGKLLAAADKIDTLSVSFSLGHKPTGSRDPYGLRRAAIGLCRLALEGGLTIDRALLPEDVGEFVEERLESILDLPVEFIRAARASAAPDLGAVGRLAMALHEERDSPAFDGVYTAYDRAHRLAGRAQDEAAPRIDPSLLVEDAERALAEALAQTSVDGAGDVRASLQSAAALAPLVERFFDEVLVMAEDSAVRANRLRLLLDVRDTLGRLGDFSQIPR